MWKNTFALAAIAGLLCACGKPNSSASRLQDLSSNVELRDVSTAKEKSQAENVALGTADSMAYNSGNPINIPPYERMVIKQGSIKLETTQYKLCMQKLWPLVKQHGAYTANEQEVRTQGSASNSLVLKVPVLQFEPLMNAISQLDGTLTEKNITSEDVSSEYVDSKSRAEAKRKLRERYFDLLKQANKMDEILLVQDKIDELQLEMEQSEGRAKFLMTTAAYSTINLVIAETPTGKATTDEEPTFYTKLKAAFTDGSTGIASLFIGLTTIWPLLIIGALLFVYFRKKQQLARQNKAIATPSGAPPTQP